MADFVKHPELNCLVDRSGVVKDLVTFKDRQCWLDKTSGKYKVLVLDENNKQISTTVSLIVAETFIPVPQELLGSPKIVAFKNRNKADHKADNLEWVSYRDCQIRTFIESRLSNKIRFGLPDYVPLANYEFEEPTECPYLPGFYYIPFTKLPIVINRDGDLYQLNNQKPHPYTLDKKGYSRTHLGSDVARKNCAIHRIVAYLFCKKPTHLQGYHYSELEVNHLDGCKENNQASNLEWCTTRENMIHAWESGLIQNKHPVLVKNILTGAVSEFESITAASEAYGIELNRLCVHLNSVSAGMSRFKNHVFMLKDNPVWPTFYSEESSDGEFKISCRFVFINKNTQEFKLFYSVVEACRSLKLLKHILQNNAQRGIMGNCSSNWWFFMPIAKFKLERMGEYCALIP